MTVGAWSHALRAQNVLEPSEQSEQFDSPSVQNILDCPSRVYLCLRPCPFCYDVYPSQTASSLSVGTQIKYMIELSVVYLKCFSIAQLSNDASQVYRTIS